MKHISIDEHLKYREINRATDTDYFIDTDFMPVNLLSTLPYLSRIQFPQARAILLRTSPLTSIITIHLLSDTDLYSSFTNFEIDLTNYVLNILIEEHYISLSLNSVG